MAHFARVDDNNIVQEVLVVPNDQEHRGQEFLAEDLGLGGRWIQTSYNDNIRKNYAGVGFIYDDIRDAFIPIQPYPSWLLNEETCRWEAPIEKPNDSAWWNEDILNWVVE